MAKATKSFLNGLSVAFIMTAASACHQDAGTVSQDKSLDNVVAHAKGQTGTDASCGPTFSDPPSLAALTAAQQTKISAMTAVVNAPDQQTKLAALSALAAAPAQLLKIVFAVIGARVDVEATASAAAKLCSSVVTEMKGFQEENDKTAGATELNSCWLTQKNWLAAKGLPPDPGTAQDPVRLQLVFPPDPVTIRANMIQLLAFTYTEYLVTLLAAPNPPAPFNQDPWPAAINSFAAHNAQLGAAFLTDIKDPHAHDQLAALQTANATAFGYLVYANAVDSYYCSSTSRSTFASQFPDTLVAFQKVNDLGEQ